MEEFIIERDTLLNYTVRDRKTVTIPEGVKIIDYRAFEWHTELVNVILPKSLTYIGRSAFVGCINLKSIDIPSSVTKIGDYAFQGCVKLKDFTIGNGIKSMGTCAFQYSGYGYKIKHKPPKNIAYKGFNRNMKCRGFKYEEGKTYVCDEAELCHQGFHACLNPLDCFDYYPDEGSVYHEVILEDRTNEVSEDSKVCGKKITIGRRLTIKEMFDIYNNLNQ